MSGVSGDLVSRLLKQSIITLCRETVLFKSRLEIDGIVCLAVDGVEQHVVKIHELFSTSTANAITVKEEPRIPTPSVTRSPSPAVVTSYTPKHKPQRQYLDDGPIESSGANVGGGVTVKEEPRVPIPSARGAEYLAKSSNRITSQLFETVPSSNKHIPEDLSIKHEVADDTPTLADTPSPPSRHASSTDLDRSMEVDKLTVSNAKNILCKKCGQTLENVSIFENHNMVSHGHFTCLICLSTFTSRNNMKRHIRLHTGVKPYVCHKCPESFSRNDDFKRHLLRHTFQKPFRCSTCKLGYSDRALVRTHMVKEHNSTVFNICPQCGECYDDIRKFQDHKKTHTEFQDYRCSLCSFTGSNALMYNKHMLTHGPHKQYTCAYCELSFPDPFTYTSHLKKHKGDELVQTYACCFCELVLPSFEQFQRHEHSHVHSKQHTCQVCQKHFRYPSNLREHMLTHIPKSDLMDASKDHTIDAKTYQPQNEPLPATVSIMPRLSELQQTLTGSGARPSTGSGTEVIEVADEMEENNNVVVKVEEPMDSNLSNDDNVSGSSEYWCTECQHGFGTETDLQNHIVSQHENAGSADEADVNEDSVVASTPKTMDCADLGANSLAKLINSDSPLPPVPSVSPKLASKIATFANNYAAKVYSENLKVLGKSLVNFDVGKFEAMTQNAKAATANKTHTAVYEEKAQGTKLNKRKSNHLGGRTFLVPKRNRVYDEDTLMDPIDPNKTRTKLQASPTASTASVSDSDAMEMVTSNHTPLRQIPKNETLMYKALYGNGTDVIDNLEIKSEIKVERPDNLSTSAEIENDKGTMGKPDATGMSAVLHGMKMKIRRDSTSAPTTPIEATGDSAAITLSQFFEVKTKPKDAAVAEDNNTVNNTGKDKANRTEDIDENDILALYSKSSVLGMDTEFSATPSRGSPTTINLKVRNPGFEKVITPEVLFETKAPFTCEICKDNYDDFATFDAHGVKVHRRFICSYCGKAFTSRPNRERHVRYHTGEKPYKCDLCPVSFFRGDDLKYHRTTKHADVKPFTCGACQSAFSYPKELEKHLKIHPDHKL